MRGAGCDAAASATPWRSLTDSVVELPVVRSGYRDGPSPCEVCPTSPCCTYLPLHTFRIGTRLDLDHAVYLLNFDRIELGLASSGDWSVAYRYPCRHLDRDDYSCGVHGEVEQPQICKTYNPHACWYRRTLTTSETDAHLRIDRPRIEAIIELLAFDGDGILVQGPEWGELHATVTAVAPEVPASSPSDPPSGDPVRDRWRALATGTGASGRRALPLALEDLDDPCDDCEAWCCTALVFPYPAPATRSNLDYLRFALGFPGIEVGITDQAWSLVVRTRCRHLQGRRCGVYDQPERPLLCEYYDQWKCTYRVHLGQERPPGYVRLAYEQWDALADCFRFDANGDIVEMLAAEAIRERVEESWRVTASG
ncbi:MAG: hypothetical protein KY469_19025 [Actinobacteria bacterium]|nr:hypothetical protein [Actinomycetota bacterium]